MKKIRRDNDFVFAWEIVRNGLPEDLSSVLEKHLYLSALGKRVELVYGVDYDITGNVVRIEITPTLANILGTYKAEFHYILPDNGLIDEDRKCAVDADVFTIVSSTAQADDSSEFTVTSDMAIAFKGDKGDSPYQTWLDAGNTGTEADYLAWIQKPATDIEQIVSVNETARVSAEGTRQTNETERINAETLRSGAESTRKTNEINRVNAEELRVTAETSRVNAEALRVEAETSRNTAEGERQTNTATAILQANAARDLANEKAGLAATATTEANTARDEANLAATAANTKAGEADTAAMAANTAAGLADTKISEMDTLMSGYDSRVVNLETGKVDKQTFADIATVKIKNLIRNGNFVNGTMHFSSSYSTLTAEDNILTATITGISKLGAPFIANSLQNASIVDNKYYITLDIQPKYDGQARFHIGGADSGYDNPSLLMIGMQWNRKSVVLTAQTIYGSAMFYSNFDTTGYVIGDVVNFKNWMCVDLTSTFGAGNEPTKEEMDLLISTLGTDYFEGEITIPAQKVMQWQLKIKEVKANKQNSLAADGTGTKFPTVDAVNAKLALKVDKSAVKQTTGTSETDVMSQKAVTDELGIKASHGYETEPKTLKQVDDVKADHGYEENPKTLKDVDDNLSQLVGDVNFLRDLATVKIKNLIENGDFRNGDAGWTGVQSVIDGWATCVSPGAGVYASADRATLEPFPENSTLWVSGTMRMNSGFDTTEIKTMIVRVGGTSSSSNFVPITDNPKSKEYANGTLMPFSIVNNISDSRSARVFIGVHVINTSVSISLKNLSLVNLTSTFGAGNEPTKAEMDTLVGILGVQYFEGEITLTQKQIMNWQLKMIRQNRNAIIALGGAII